MRSTNKDTTISTDNHRDGTDPKQSHSLDLEAFVRSCPSTNHPRTHIKSQLGMQTTRFIARIEAESTVN